MKSECSLVISTSYYRGEPHPLWKGFPIFEEVDFRESTSEGVLDSDESLKAPSSRDMAFSRNCTVDVSIAF